MVEIIYEDNHLLLLNKPALLLTQPSGTEQPSLEQAAKQWIKERDHKPGAVSGLVLFAKTSKALSRIQSFTRERKSQKIYLAWVEGALWQSGRLQHYLTHEAHHAKVFPVAKKEAKLATLRYRVIETKNQVSLVEIELETGRYHQIRAQFAAIGHPICGDLRYGSQTEKLPAEIIALHHLRLTLPHPISKKIVEFTAPLPDYFCLFN